MHPHHFVESLTADWGVVKKTNVNTINSHSTVNKYPVCHNQPGSGWANHQAVSKRVSCLIGYLHIKIDQVYKVRFISAVEHLIGLLSFRWDQSQICPFTKLCHHNKWHLISDSKRWTWSEDLWRKKAFTGFSCFSWSHACSVCNSINKITLYSHLTIPLIIFVPFFLCEVRWVFPAQSQWTLAAASKRLIISSITLASAFKAYCLVLNTNWETQIPSKHPRCLCRWVTSKASCLL